MNKPYAEFFGDSFHKDGKDVPLVYPNERGDGPYFCSECGQTESFMIYGVSLPIHVQNDNGAFNIHVPQAEIQKSIDMLTTHPSFMSGIDDNADIEIKEAVTRQLAAEGGITLLEPDAGLICLVCGGNDVRKRMDQIFRCQMDNCPGEGCFLCGQTYDTDEITSHCVECLQSRYLTYASWEDRTPTLFQLDLDITCSSCPMYHLRLEHGINNEILKMKAY